MGGLELPPKLPPQDKALQDALAQAHDVDDELAALEDLLEPTDADETRKDQLKILQSIKNLQVKITDNKRDGAKTNLKDDELRLTALVWEHYVFVLEKGIVKVENQKQALEDAQSGLASARLATKAPTMC